MKAFLVVLLILLLIPVSFLVGGWIWMLCLGALSHIFKAPSLAISFWQAVLVNVIFYILLGGAFARNGRG